LALQERERADETSATANRVIAMLEERIRRLESSREAEIAQARYERAEARVVEVEAKVAELQARLHTADNILPTEYDRMGKTAEYIEMGKQARNDLYRKRPVTVEAIQFTAHNREEIERFLADTPHSWDRGLVILTLEGDLHVSVGDYIIRGVAGEVYPCKPDIFEMTYELVTETEGGDGEPAKNGLSATGEYDRVRREDAWTGVYTDGTPVRLLPQSVADAMRDELLAYIADLRTALAHWMTDET